jgi:hypothetical protein
LNKGERIQMEFKAIADFLFYIKHKYSRIINIDEDIDNLKELYSEFEQLNFNIWLINGSLLDEYFEFTKNL